MNLCQAHPPSLKFVKFVSGAPGSRIFNLNITNYKLNYQKNLNYHITLKLTCLFPLHMVLVSCTCSFSVRIQTGH